MNREQLIEYLVSHLRLFHELQMKCGRLRATTAELDEFLSSERNRFEQMETSKLQHIYWRNYVYEDFFDNLATVRVSETMSA